MSTENSFDIVVVGSSPMLLLYALHEESKGKRVCLIERAPNLGGAWAVAYSPDIPSRVPLETSCHLVEWYDGGYELLEQLSKEDFQSPLVPQPVRIFKKGSVHPYTSRLVIFRSFLFTIAFLVYCALRFMLSVFRRDLKDAVNRRQNFVSAWRSLKFDFTFRILSLQNCGGVREPEGGFASWMERQIARLAASRVALIRDSVTQANRRCLHDWEIVLASGKRLKAAKLVMGESAALQNFDGETLKQPIMTRYFHAVISFDVDDVLIQNRYIHCPDNPCLHRLCYMFDVQYDTGASRSVWLAQFRVPQMTELSVHSELEKLSKFYPFIKPKTKPIIVTSLESSFVQRTEDAAIRITTEPDFLVLKTIGDLSRNVLFAKKFQGAFS